MTLAATWGSHEVYQLLQSLGQEIHRLRQDIVLLNVDLVRLSQDMAQQGQHHRMVNRPVAENVRAILSIIRRDVRLDN